MDAKDLLPQGLWSYFLGCGECWNQDSQGAAKGTP